MDWLTFNLPLRMNVDILIAEECCCISTRQYKDLIRFFVALLEVTEQYRDQGFPCTVFPKSVVFFTISQYHGGGGHGKRGGNEEPRRHSFQRPLLQV
jgi:hypothetical protein